jgi:hypothetical protein
MVAGAVVGIVGAVGSILVIGGYIDEGQRKALQDSAGQIVPAVFVIAAIAQAIFTRMRAYSPRSAAQIAIVNAKAPAGTPATLIGPGHRCFYTESGASARRKPVDDRLQGVATLPEDSPFHRLTKPLVCLPAGMGVQIRRHRNRGMAGPVLDGMQALPGCRRQRQARVTHRVRRDPRHASRRDVPVQAINHPPL